MTDNQRNIYLFLLMCGRETEAIQYRDNCETNKDLPNVSDRKPIVNKCDTLEFSK